MVPLGKGGEKGRKRAVGAASGDAPKREKGSHSGRSDED